MKVDLYTKFILTIIAASLVLIAGSQIKLVPEAHAQSGSDMRDAISGCWDGATLHKRGDEWTINTRC